MRALRRLAALLALGVISMLGAHRVHGHLFTAGRLNLLCSCGGDAWIRHDGSGEVTERGGSCRASRILAWGQM